MDSKKAWSVNGFNIALICILLLVALVRIRLSPIPFMCDEGEYAYMGKLILHGGMPYRDAYNMKLPGTFLMYALIMTFFGSSPVGVHTGFLIVSLVTIIVLYAAFRKLFSPVVALVAVAIYGLLSVSMPLYGFAAHATHFLNLFLALGLWFYARFVDNKGKLPIFLSGLMLGLAFLVKQQGASVVIPVGIAFLLPVLFVKPVNWKQLALNASLYSAGVILPYLLVVVAVLATGSFRQFWFWTVDYANVYVNEIHIGWNGMISDFTGHFHWIFVEFEIIWWLAVAGLVVVWFSKYDLQKKIFVLLFAFFSFASVWPGYYFRAHYFIVLLPAAGLLAGIVLEFLAGLIPAGRYKHVTRLLPLVIIFIIGAREISNSWFYYYSAPLSEIHRIAYGTYQFFDMVQVGKYIAEHSKPEDKIAILGSQPEVMVYADRQSATGYIYVFPLTEQQKYNEQMQQEMIVQITAAKPKYLVYDTGSWVWQPNDTRPRDIINWSARYIPLNYVLVGLVDCPFKDKPSDLYWDEAANRVPSNERSIKVYRLK